MHRPHLSASFLSTALVGASAVVLVACTDGDDAPAAPTGGAGTTSHAMGGLAGSSSNFAGTGGGGGQENGQADSGATASPEAEAPDTGSPGAQDAAAAVDAGPIQHHFMAVEYPGRIVEISADGKLLWEHMTPSLSVMFNVLPNGNVFYPHGGPTAGAQEVDKNHTVVWSYTSTAMELLGGERMANGNTLLGQGGPALAVELTPAKQVARSITIPTTTTEAHRVVRHLHRLANGNILAALEGEGAAREFDAAGKMVWEYTGVMSIHEAIRLPTATRSSEAAHRRRFSRSPAPVRSRGSSASRMGLRWAWPGLAAFRC